MKPNNISEVAKNLGGIISKNSPTILTGLAVGGLVTTVIFTHKAAIKAHVLVENEQFKLTDEQEGVFHNEIILTPKEILKLTWTLYIPAACMGTATIACIIGSNSINQRRNAALATVYNLTKVAFKEYEDKVVEQIGKNKATKIKDEIAAERLKKNPVGDAEVIFTGQGDVMCYDSLSGRYFKSDIEKIRRTINEMNKTLLNDMWVGLNDLYYELGLSDTKLGELMGWELDNGLVDVSFSTQLTDKGEPCLVLNYEVVPKFN